jgi:hypothetical protein
MEGMMQEVRIKIIITMGRDQWSREQFKCDNVGNGPIWDLYNTAQRDKPS